MPDQPNPKNEVDENGVLLAARFIAKLPGRTSGGNARIAAVRKLAPALQARPQQWAAVMEGSPHACSNIQTAFRQGKILNVPGDHWEAAVRRDPTREKTSVLYVRFLGPRPPRR